MNSKFLIWNAVIWKIILFACAENGEISSVVHHLPLPLALQVPRIVLLPSPDRDVSSADSCYAGSVTDRSKREPRNAESKLPKILPNLGKGGFCPSVQDRRPDADRTKVGPRPVRSIFWDRRSRFGPVD